MEDIVQKIFDALRGEGAELEISEVHGFPDLIEALNALGINETTFTIDQLNMLISQLDRLPTPNAGISLDNNHDASGHDFSVSPREVSFGAAGSCYNCYGTGVVWSFSERKNKKCSVCGGSGIGPV
ncbi:hypothetical protein KKP04_06335 [Rhodomicrobium sp. Az07]|uniref:hypothetical protein n=1 Tax=Rhodomicrobium sp. Az07 TaxID=2839034 RepID=UPI001BE6E5CE|nr:hypothetical protein [Rhodomicrobium sp. Az07]MBT3070482.1 hypothetical protein [Rhodomicrobium sp. Az07]